ncbi:MAG: RNA methyltransferase [Verrucomicrobia bacterium]|jgi:TrmH family RNA methyltransferase|nr:RNA methyltransferase [Verrucomicrobiota bacterium]
METPYIQSRQHEQVKNLVKLRERKHRDRQSRFLIEGLREIGHALSAGFAVDHLYFCPQCFPESGEHADFVDNKLKTGAWPITRLSPEAFDKASHREGPDGLIAVATQQNNTLSDLKPGQPALLLVLEGIEKPGNLGAILRSADGASVDAVILVDCVLDLYNPNAVRSSQGLIFALPIVSTDRESLSQWLDAHKISCLATTPEAENLHWDVDYRGSCALFLGSESDGLSPFWLDHSEQKIRIPMAGQADSLNVAAAAAVCLYEAKRQRSVSP